MASNVDNNALDQTFSQLSQALKRLEAASALSLQKMAQNAQGKEAIQEEMTAGWQSKLADMEANVTALHEENSFLKEDNMRLSNQLQALQQEYVALQKMAEQTLSRLDGSVSQLDMLLEH